MMVLMSWHKNSYHSTLAQAVLATRLMSSHLQTLPTSDSHCTKAKVCSTWKAKEYFSSCLPMSCSTPLRELASMSHAYCLFLHKLHTWGPGCESSDSRAWKRLVLSPLSLLFNEKLSCKQTHESPAQQFLRYAWVERHPIAGYVAERC